MTIALPASMASWIQSISCVSLFDWRNSSGTAPASSRHRASISASVVLP